MTWTRWNELVGSKMVSRALEIARREHIETPCALAIEALLRQARLELSREAGIDRYEPVYLETI